MTTATNVKHNFSRSVSPFPTLEPYEHLKAKYRQLYENQTFFNFVLYIPVPIGIKTVLY